MTLIDSPTGPRRRAVFATAVATAMLLLAAVAPALGYNGQNEEQVLLTRLDAVRCGAPGIRLAAFVTDAQARPVPGVTVLFQSVSTKPGDTLQPTTVATDAGGRATTTVTLVCPVDGRAVTASVPSGASARLTLTATESGVLSATGQPAAVLPNTSGGTGARDQSPPPGPPFGGLVLFTPGVLLAMAVALGLLYLLRTSRRAHGN